MFGVTVRLEFKTAHSVDFWSSNIKIVWQYVCLSVKNMFIFGITFVANGSRLIWLFEFGFSASELQFQQHTAGALR